MSNSDSVRPGKIKTSIVAIKYEKTEVTIETVSISKTIIFLWKSLYSAVKYIDIIMSICPYLLSDTY